MLGEIASILSECLLRDLVKRLWFNSTKNQLTIQYATSSHLCKDLQTLNDFLLESFQIKEKIRLLIKGRDDKDFDYFLSLTF